MSDLRQVEKHLNPDYKEDTVWVCDEHPTKHEFIERYGSKEIMAKDGRTLKPSEVRSIKSSTCPLCE